MHKTRLPRLLCHLRLGLGCCVGRRALDLHALPASLPALLHRAAPHPTPLAPLKSPSPAAPSPASISSVAGAVVPPQPIADAELGRPRIRRHFQRGVRRSSWLVRKQIYL